MPFIRRMPMIAVALLVACSASTSPLPSIVSSSTPSSTPAATPSPTPCPIPPLSLGMALAVTDPTWSRCDIDGLATCPREADGSVRFVNSERAGRLQAKPMSANVDLTSATGPPPSVAPSARESEAPIAPVSGMTVQVVLVVNLLAPSAARKGTVLAATTGGGFISWVGQGMLVEVTADGATGRVTFVDLPVTGAGLPDWPIRLSGEVTWLCPSTSS